jgi:hypothetical protein
MRKQALISLILLGTIMVVFASIGGVQATTVTLINEHHPASSFKDPSDTYDGYLIGQTVTWHIHLNVTTSKAPFPWLSITNLTITDTLPNLDQSPSVLYMTYVRESQDSSSVTGAAAFTDFGNGTLFWNFGTGPFTTGVLAPPPLSNLDEHYTASVTFNTTIVGTVPDNTLLTNKCAVNYTETFSGVHSTPATSDAIWVHVPSFVVPQATLLITPGACFAVIFGLVVYVHRRKKRKH